MVSWGNKHYISIPAHLNKQNWELIRQDTFFSEGTKKAVCEWDYPRFLPRLLPCQARTGEIVFRWRHPQWRWNCLGNGAPMRSTSMTSALLWVSVTSLRVFVYSEIRLSLVGCRGEKLNIIPSCILSALPSSSTKSRARTHFIDPSTIIPKTL